MLVAGDFAAGILELEKGIFERIRHINRTIIYPASLAVKMTKGDFLCNTKKMRLGAVRDLMGIKQVLMDPESKGPELVYMVVSGMTKERWENLTIITAGRFGKEFPKTFGHYHGTETPETYRVISGEGVLQVQKKHFDEKMWVWDQVEEVILVKVKAGDEVTITPEYGHSMSNTGEAPLLTYDDWRAGHDPTDYAMIEKMQGLAYYLVEEGGGVKALPNPKYQSLPEPKWMTAEEFNSFKKTKPQRQ